VLRGAMAPLLLLCYPQRLTWPPPDWRILAGDQPAVTSNSGSIPSPTGHFWADFQENWEFLGAGANLLAILATVGILKLVAFEFVPGVRRGLDCYCYDMLCVASQPSDSPSTRGGWGLGWLTDRVSVSPESHVAREVLDAGLKKRSESMKTIPSWHSVWTIVLVAVGMVVAPAIGTAGESPERSANPRPARRAAPPQRRAGRAPDRDAALSQRGADDRRIRTNAPPARRTPPSQPRAPRGPDRDRDVRRGPSDAVTRPSPGHPHGLPPTGSLTEIARRMLAGSPMGLLSDVAAKLLSDVAVKLFSGNEAELLSGNEAELLSGNEAQLLSGNAPELLSGNETQLLSGNEPEILSGNRAQILSGNAVTLFSGNHISITLNNSGNGNGSEVATAAGKEFASLDKDRDGRLSFDEFRSRKTDRQVRKAHKRFRRRDVDLSGALTLREFALLH
jgi:hypothetical protein